MKRSPVVFAFLVSALFAACGTKKPEGVDRPLAQAYLQKMQNDQGCLDIDKVIAEINQGGKARTVLTDIVIEEDGNPASEGFVRTVIHDSPVDHDSSPVDHDSKADLGYRQNGCATLEAKENATDEQKLSGRKSIRLITATPTRLVTEEVPVGADDFPSGYNQITFELVGNRELRVTVSTPFTSPHGCEVEKDSVQENHQVDLVGVVDWGSHPLDITPSGRLSSLKTRAAAYDLHDQHEKDLEKAYCEGRKK